MEELKPHEEAGAPSRTRVSWGVREIAVHVFSVALAALGIVWAGDFLIDAGLPILTEQVLAAVLAFALAIIFLSFNIQCRKAQSLAWQDAIFAIAGLAGGFYLAWRYPLLAQESFYRPTECTIVGALLVILSAEALRRTAGLSLFIVLMIFFAYALLGHLIPGPLSGRSLPPSGFFGFLGIDNTALLGLPMRVIVSIVIVYVFFGQVLQNAGGSAFFTDLAGAMMGRARGGSAKIAIVASGFFGTISGSAVSNVVSTGVITIPMMKKTGYSAPMAGAIEAVASTGGQIMPPIMGAAAFLMAELLGVQYRDVVIAAIVPALLYYMSVFLQADFEAARTNIQPVPEDQILPLRQVLREGWHFTAPFVVLLFALFQFNASAEKSALYGIVTIALLGLIFSYRGQKLTFRLIYQSLKESGSASVDIVVIGAAAGLILGILDRTGLSFGLTLILVQIGEKNLLLLLTLTAIIGIILGMGMPTTAIYFLLATLAAPPMIKLGVEPMAAHMFVFYFGILSMITPPVALAAFTAAKLASANPMTTAIFSCRFGWPAFIIPFLFVASPTLILQGEPVPIIIACLTAAAGIWIASGGFAGYLMGHLNRLFRLGFVAAGLGLLVPAQAFPGAWVFEIFGAVLAALLITVHKLRQSKVVISNEN